ncbi:hypothetical protein HMPREF3227_01357 [Corynebacterium sp. CMW7794]|nr:hypothetical protein HMPREF3227_01357 [Corynebacterium sp. CMW7794]
MRPQAKGLIPAHAGSTHRTPLRRCGRWAHPRSRGEHLSRQRRHIRIPGSSPLTRGAPDSRKRPGEVRRLIPAHAGSTSAQDCRWAVYGAHPRSRGEH